MKRSTLNLGLLAVAAGLGAALWFAPGQEPDPKASGVLTPLAPGALTRLTLAHPGQPPVVLEKKPLGWTIVAPHAGRADPQEVDGLAAVAASAWNGQIDPATRPDLKELGLSPPAFTMTFAAPGKTPVRVDFGATTPFTNNRYARVGKQLVLADDPAGSGFDADPSDLYDKALLPPNAVVAKLALPDGHVVSRGPTDVYTLQSPIGVAPPASLPSPTALASLVAGWKGASALYNGPAEAGDAQLPQAVTVTLADSTTRVFRVAAIAPQLILARPDLGIRQVLSGELSNRLLNPQAALPALALPSSLGVSPTPSTADAEAVVPTPPSS